MHNPRTEENTKSTIIDRIPYLHYYHPPSHNDDFSQLSTSSSSSSLTSVLYLPRPPHFKELVASGLLLSYFYDDPADEDHWTQAVEKFLSNSSQSLPHQYSFSIPISKKGKKSSLAAIIKSHSISLLPFCPIPWLNFLICYFLLSIYVIVSWDVSSVRSKIGLFIAFFAQTNLAMFSSFTITSYFFPTFSHESVRHFLIIPIFIFISGIENISRLLNQVSRTARESSPTSRIASGFTSSFEKTLKVTLVNTMLLLFPCLPYFSVCSQIKHICIFTLVALYVDLVLHATYFLAVLFVDLRRVELEDLLSENLSLSTKSENRPFYSKLYNIPEKLPKPFKKQYRYIRHIYYHPKISLSRFILLVSLIVLYTWGYFSDENQRHIYSSGKLPFFFSKLASTAQILSNYSYINLYEPIVIQGFRVANPNKQITLNKDIQFSIGPSILGTCYNFIRIMTFNVLLELVASIAFILSLTGVILKFMLPPPSERQEEVHEEKSGETVKFSSKDLVGFHSLDVLQVVAQGPTIATVSLDHKVCVWNASSTASNGSVKPIPIPLPNELWPVTRLMLNPANSVIAIFSSRAKAIHCWDYKNHVVLYHLQDQPAFNFSPIETFFSGSDLVVVTRTREVVSISEKGELSQFPIDFPSKTSSVAYARRLLTPRIPERVICVSTENEIAIGTHIRISWKFRRLQIQESPLQLSMHLLHTPGGAHDLSKYKPQPIPAPQAMMTRMPMRPGRMAAMNATSNIPPIRRPKILDEKLVSMVPVPAINMIIIATPLHACLFDAQTGIIVKHFQIGHLKPQSLRAFHSQPTHCRFCGCVSVDTFSIAYSDAEHDGLVITHTLTIDNRAKNSICIRVERDPRETRCLGFEATTERQHWIDRVEGWETTDMNMIMGVRKKESNFTEESNLVETTNNKGISSSSLFGSTDSSSGLRRRGDNSKKLVPKSLDSPYRYQSHSNSASSLSLKSNPTNIWNLLSDYISSLGLFNDHKSVKPHNCKQDLRSTLNMTWEGWAMSATGQVTYYDIPDTQITNARHRHKGNDGNSPVSPSCPAKYSPGSNSNWLNSIGSELDSISYDQLLIQSIGPVTKYGTKSIAVAFGNIIKVLYFGREESVSSKDEAEEQSQNPGLKKKPSSMGIHPSHSRKSSLHIHTNSMTRPGEAFTNGGWNGPKNHFK